MAAVRLDAMNRFNDCTKFVGLFVVFLLCFTVVTSLPDFTVNNLPDYRIITYDGK